MLIIKLVLTIIALSIIYKSLRYFLRYSTPLSLSLAAVGVLMFFISWAPEILTLFGVSQSGFVNSINFDIVITATIALALFIYGFLRLGKALHKSQVELTNLTRSLAIENACEIK